jgi:hypothetical protein
MLVTPFKIFLNTDSTAVIVTDNADVLLKTVPRSQISIQNAGSLDRIRVFLNDSDSYLYTDILNAAGATYGANRDLAAKELSNLAGFSAGGGGGSVNSVTASLPLTSSGGANPNISFDGELPIFLTETSTFADIQANRLHIYVGNAPLTIDLDTEIPFPPLPIPTQQNFSVANQSGFVFSIISSGGGGGFSIPARYAYATGITITDGGGGYWEANPAIYVLAPTLQQVLSSNNVAVNTNAIFQDTFNTQETRFYYDGFFAKDVVGNNELWYNSRFIRKESTGLKTWFLNPPDLSGNANSSSYNVGFRPDVSGTVAYLSDIPSQTRFTQQSGNITAGSQSNTHYYYSFNALGQLTLPTAIGNTSTYQVKNASAVNITVVFTAGQNADGSTSILLIPNQSLVFISNNVNFDIN